MQTLQAEIEEKYPKVYNDYLNIDYQPASGISKEQEKKLSDMEQEITTMKYAFDILLQSMKDRKLLPQDYTIEDLWHDVEERAKQQEEILKAENE